MAFPRERYACSGGPAYFVGVTIIDDQDYRPRRCIFAHPTVGGSLRLTFADVPLGKVIRGHAGLSYFLARDGLGTPVELSAFAGDRELGRHEHHDEWGWREFEFSTGDFAGTTQDVDFEIERAPLSTRLLLQRGDLLMEPLSRSDRWIAFGLAAAYVAWVLATASSLGYARDEGFYFAAARS